MVSNVIVDGDKIERVGECKLLGVILNNRQSWHDYIESMMKKANTHLDVLFQLKRTKLPAERNYQGVCDFGKAPTGICMSSVACQAK